MTLDTVRIDGAMGEGGGQVLRTALTLAMLTGRPLEMVNVRANRPKPGLQPQHLTALRAAAEICAADTRGDSLGSSRLTFTPRRKPASGEYRFDVRDAANGSSAGATTLICQTVLLPLAFAGESSTVTLLGGTHVPFSPPFEYLQEVYLPALASLGIRSEARLLSRGWYPAGGGHWVLAVEPITMLPARTWTDRGELQRISGIGVATNLPSHIPQRMVNRAANLLAELQVPCDLRPLRERSKAPGAGIFVLAEYDGARALCSALGRPGKPAEQVAEEACRALLALHRTGTNVAVVKTDSPVANDSGKMSWSPRYGSTATASSHLLTNIQVVQHFLNASIRVEQSAGRAMITVRGDGFHV